MLAQVANHSLSSTVSLTIAPTPLLLLLLLVLHAMATTTVAPGAPTSSVIDVSAVAAAAVLGFCRFLCKGMLRDTTVYVCADQGLFFNCCSTLNYQEHKIRGPQYRSPKYYNPY